MTDREQLVQYATEYVKDKAEMDKLKKRVESNNTAIKQLLELLNEEAVELEDGTRIVYSVTRKESFAEEKLVTEKKLINIIKHFAPDTQCIKTKEYIDMDVLENEIYHGKLSDDALCAMDSCRNVKEVPVLNIKKPKKGKK